jgi:hypothetical protein
MSPRGRTSVMTLETRGVKVIIVTGALEGEYCRGVVGRITEGLEGHESLLEVEPGDGWLL